MSSKKTERRALSQSEIESLMDKAMSRKDVQKELNARGILPGDFRESLKFYIMRSLEKNKGLRTFAKALDTTNKSTVPVDAVLDYFNIMGGVGSAARALKTIAMSPGYLAYDVYYAVKTGDILGALKNAAYEAVSWFIPGSLPHLIKRYTNQAERYVVEDASKQAIEAVRRSKAEQGGLEELAKAA